MELKKLRPGKLSPVLRLLNVLGQSCNLQNQVVGASCRKVLSTKPSSAFKSAISLHAITTAVLLLTMCGCPELAEEPAE